MSSSSSKCKEAGLAMHIAQEAPMSPGLAPSAGWQGQDTVSTAPAPARAEEHLCGLVRESWLQSAHLSTVSTAVVVHFQPQMLHPQASLQRCHECCQGSATTCSDRHQSCHHPSLSATGGRLGRKCHHCPCRHRHFERTAGCPGSLCTSV